MDVIVETVEIDGIVSSRWAFDAPRTFFHLLDDPSRAPRSRMYRQRWDLRPTERELDEWVREGGRDYV